MRNLNLIAALALVGGAVLTMTASGPVHAAYSASTADESDAYRPDAWITAKAKLALITAERVDSFDISIDTVNGYVTLSGDVASAVEKSEAERIVREIKGVRDVRNLLTFMPADHDRANAERIDDDDLEEQLEDALADGWGLDGIDVEIESVDDGVVVLEGEADSISVEQRTLTLVRHFPGVVRVVDRIEGPDELRDEEIRRPMNVTLDDDERSLFEDGWITTEVKLALMADDRVPALDVNVDTYDGEVTLFGIVPDEPSKRAAEVTARGIDRVKSVRNEVQVVPDSRRDSVEATDEVVADRVEEALADADELLAGADFDIDVKNGVVRLTGELEHEAQRLGAVTLVRSVPGVRAVLTSDLRSKLESEE